MSSTVALGDASRVLTVRVDGAEYPVEVTRKRVKNLNLRVHRDGSVVLSIPMRTSMRSAQEFLDRKARWIAERVRRARERESLRQGSNTPGHMPLWGELVPCDPSHAGQSSIDELYRSEVRRVLPEVAARMERAVGVHATRWGVRVMKTRWGSCTPSTGSIRVNARLAAFPPECLEFVVAHELVHLLEPSHNARFHALLDEFCPDNRRLARRLKQGPVSTDAT